MSLFDNLLKARGLTVCPIPLWQLKINDEEYQALKAELVSEAIKPYDKSLFRGLQREAALFVSEYWRREYYDGSQSEQDVYDALFFIDQPYADRFVKCDKFMEEAKQGAKRLNIEIYSGVRQEVFYSMLYQGGLPMRAISRIASPRWHKFTEKLVQDKIDFEELRERLGKISTEIWSIKAFCEQLITALNRDLGDLMPFDCKGQTGMAWFTFLKELAIKEKKRLRQLRPLSIDWEFLADERAGEIKLINYLVSGPQRLSEEFLKQNQLDRTSFFSVQVRINGKPGDSFDFQNGFCRDAVFSKHPYHNGDVVSVFLHDHKAPYISDSVSLDIPHILYRSEGKYHLGNRLGKTRSLILIPDGWILEDKTLPLQCLSWEGIKFQGLFLNDDIEKGITLRNEDGKPLSFCQDSNLYWTEIESAPLDLPYIIETIYDASKMHFRLCSDRDLSVSQGIPTTSVEYRCKGESGFSESAPFGIVEAYAKRHGDDFVSPVRFINAGGLSIVPLSMDKDHCTLKLSWEHGKVFCKEGTQKSKGDIWEVLRIECPDPRVIHFTLVPTGHSHAQFDISVRAPFKDFIILNNDDEPVDNNCQIPYADIDKYQYHLVGQGVQSYTFGDITREIIWESGQLFIYENGREIRTIPYDGSLVTLFGSRELLRSMLDRTSRSIINAEISVSFIIDRNYALNLSIKDYPFRLRQQEDGRIAVTDSREVIIPYHHALNVFNLEEPNQQFEPIRADKDGLFSLPDAVRPFNKILLTGRTRGRILPAMMDAQKILSPEERKRNKVESIANLQKEIDAAEIGSSTWKRILSWFRISQREGIPTSSILELDCLAHGSGDALLSFAFQLFLECSDEEETNELIEQLIQFGNALSFQWYWLKPKSDSILQVLSFILEGNTPVLQKMAFVWARNNGIEFEELFPIIKSDVTLNEHKPRYCNWVLEQFSDWLRHLFRASVLDSYLLVEDDILSYIAGALAGDRDENGRPMSFVTIRTLDEIMIDLNQEDVDKDVNVFFEDNFPHPDKPLNERWMLGRADAMAAHLRGKINLFSVCDSIRRSILFCRRSCPKAFLIAVNNKLS